MCYKLVLEVTRQETFFRVTLFENDDFAVCLGRAWNLIHDSGVPASQLDILRRDDETGLFFSVWSDYLTFKEGGPQQ